MSRVGLIVAASAAVMGVALGGCSGGMPSLDWMTPSMPDWMSSKPASAPLQALRFESDPPGADVRTTQGQTCQTPCALAVATENQSVAFTKDGYVPQSVNVIARESTEQSAFASLFSSPPRTLAPNPVQVVLQAVPPPPPPPAKPKPHQKTVARTQTVAKTTPAPQPDSASPFPNPPALQQTSSPFPPPTTMR